MSTQKGQFVREREKPIQAAEDGHQEIMYITLRYTITMQYSSQWNTPVTQIQHHAIKSYDILA